MQFQINNLQIELEQGDLTKKQVDAIVNAANPQMIPGGGVDGAINFAAGPCLGALQRSLGPIEVGQAVITPGFDLPAKYVIHTAGPIWRGGKQHESELLANCYRHALQLAAQHQLRSIAFPAISTGVYGFPIELAAELVCQVVLEFAKSETSVVQISFVNFDAKTEAIYEAVFAEEILG